MILTDIIKSTLNFLSAKLTFPDSYNGKIVKMDDGKTFKVFRYMKLKHSKDSSNKSVYVVRFKFSKFSHNKNIKLSRIPMFLIAGFPGFRKKIWMIDYKEDYWQGAYEWDNAEAINKYRRSTVLGIMNKRAIAESVTETIVENTTLSDYLKERMDYEQRVMGNE